MFPCKRTNSITCILNHALYSLYQCSIPCYSPIRRAITGANALPVVTFRVLVTGMLFFLVALRMVDDAGGATELWRRYIVEMLIYLPRPLGCEPAKARVRFWREYHGTAIAVVAESLAVLN